MDIKSTKREATKEPKKVAAQQSKQPKKVAANTKKQSTIKAKLKSEQVNTVKMEQPNKVKQPTVGQPEANEKEASHIKQTLSEPLQKITKMEATNVQPKSAIGLKVVRQAAILSGHQVDRRSAQQGRAAAGGHQLDIEDKENNAPMVVHYHFSNCFNHYGAKNCWCFES